MPSVRMDRFPATRAKNICKSMVCTDREEYRMSHPPIHPFHGHRNAWGEISNIPGTLFVSECCIGEQRLGMIVRLYLRFVRTTIAP